MTLKQKFQKIAEEYVSAFEIKQGFDNDPEKYWVSDIAGTTLFINDYFFNFDDIRHDVDHNIEAGKITEWYDYVLEKQDYKINYTSYLIGAR